VVECLTRKHEIAFRNLIHHEQRDGIGAACDGVFVLVPQIQRWHCYPQFTPLHVPSAFRAVCLCTPSPPPPSPPPLPPTLPPSAPQIDPMILTCQLRNYGVYVQGFDSCWFLTHPGQACISLCGGLKQTDWATTIRNASDEAVVSALTQSYGLSSTYLWRKGSGGFGDGESHLHEGLLDSTVAANLNLPCGQVSVAAPTAQYLYMPDAGFWDCFEHESFMLIDKTFRSPCLCEPSPSVDAVGAIAVGIIVALLVLLMVKLCGSAFYWFSRGDLILYSVPFEPIVLTCSVLAVLDQVATIWQLWSFAVESEWQYFLIRISMVVLAVSLESWFSQCHMITGRRDPIGSTVGDTVFVYEEPRYKYGVIVEMIGGRSKFTSADEPATSGLMSIKLKDESNTASFSSAAAHTAALTDAMSTSVERSFECAVSSGAPSASSVNAPCSRSRSRSRSIQRNIGHGLNSARTRIASFDRSAKGAKHAKTEQGAKHANTNQGAKDTNDDCLSANSVRFGAKLDNCTNVASSSGSVQALETARTFETCRSTKPAESQPPQSQSSESQPKESQPSESQPPQSQPSESQPKESQSSESQPKESQPARAWYIQNGNSPANSSVAAASSAAKASIARSRWKQSITEVILTDQVQERLIWRRKQRQEMIKNLLWLRTAAAQRVKVLTNALLPPPIGNVRMKVQAYDAQGQYTEHTEIQRSFNIHSTRHAPLFWSSAARKAAADADDLLPLESFGQVLRFIKLRLFAASPTLALLSGLAVPIEGFHSVFARKRASRSFCVLHLIRARVFSAPNVFYSLVVVMRVGYYMVYMQFAAAFGNTIAAAKVDLRLQVLSLFLSALNLLSSLMHFCTSPATDPLSAMTFSAANTKPPTLLLALATYFISDVTLRAVAVMCFAYGLSEDGWRVFIGTCLAGASIWMLLKARTPSMHMALRAYGVRSWLFELCEAVMSLTAPRMLFAVTASARRAGAFTSTFACLLLMMISITFGSGSLSDAQFQWYAIVICTTAMACKLATFFWCVLPAFTGNKKDALICAWMPTINRAFLIGRKKQRR